VAISEWTKKEAFNAPGTPQPASDFLSLSPLQFGDVSQLAKKLIALKPKGKRRGEDDSSANKAFLGSITQAGQLRSAFEHSRYNIISTFSFLINRVGLLSPGYCFMPLSIPLTFGDSV
jgi:hypothetical protein